MIHREATAVLLEKAAQYPVLAVTGPSQVV